MTVPVFELTSYSDDSLICDSTPNVLTSERPHRRTSSFRLPQAVSSSFVREFSPLIRHASLKVRHKLESTLSCPLKTAHQLSMSIPRMVVNSMSSLADDDGVSSEDDDPEVLELEERNNIIQKYDKFIFTAQGPESKDIDPWENPEFDVYSKMDRFGFVQQQSLLNVLAAYSMYNTEVGYCQGFFVPGFPKLSRFEEHFKKVLKKYKPRIFKHLEKQDIPYIYLTKWWFGCFLDRVPFSLALRLWDVYILEGDPILIAMALNIMKMHETIGRSPHLKREKHSKDAITSRTPSVSGIKSVLRFDVLKILVLYFIFITVYCNIADEMLQMIRVLLVIALRIHAFSF
uniref:Rab-GAP TBC domain-containing protein n=1 Tax=Heterorhabditis bacteriophora TaxID=37862 RepID=A0A1I7WBN7_HETBA